jgi:diguanylate cyclase (GGDEF)-like protein
MSNSLSVPPLDLFTVKAMTLITTLIVSAATLLAWRINRRVAGMRLFALGLFSIASGAIFGISRVVVPGNAVLIACNALMFAGMLAVAQSVRVFRRFRPLPNPAVCALAGTVAALFLYWLMVRDVFAIRVAIMSGAFALLSCDAALSMLRGTPARDRAVYWPTGIAFGFAALYLAARAAVALSGGYGTNLLAPVPMELASTICGNVACCSCAFGMVLASNAQLRYDAEKLALYDPLTSLPNRRLLLDRLLEAERRALSDGSRLGVIYLDLDGFKHVNDTFGHEAGDELLRNVSLAMARVLRSDDCLARIGGDEFVVLIEGAEGRSQILTLAERLKEAVESQPISRDSPTTMRASFGAAVFPGDGLSAHDVMREADAAMYHAKRQSRLTVQPAVVWSRPNPRRVGQ